MSTPVAIFDGLQVRHIAGDGQGKQSLDPAAELAKRTRAGEALLKNPHIDVSDAARPVLADGGLDLRAAAVLSGLSSQINVALHDLTPVPVEAAAGTPIRAITLYTVDADPGPPPACPSRALSYCPHVQTWTRRRNTRGASPSTAEANRTSRAAVRPLKPVR